MTHERYSSSLLVLMFVGCIAAIGGIIWTGMSRSYAQDGTTAAPVAQPIPTGSVLGPVEVIDWSLPKADQVVELVMDGSDWRRKIDEVSSRQALQPDPGVDSGITFPRIVEWGWSPTEVDANGKPKVVVRAKNWCWRATEIDGVGDDWTAPFKALKTSRVYLKSGGYVLVAAPFEKVRARWLGAAHLGHMPCTGGSFTDVK